MPQFPLLWAGGHFPSDCAYNSDVLEVASLRDHVFAATLAEHAGELLLSIRGGGLRGKSLGDMGDLESNSLILAELKSQYPADAVLSEESSDTGSRLTNRRVWIIDPLDGTREFMEVERTDWAVHVALAVDGVAVVGAVALPARRMILSTGSSSPVSAIASHSLRLVVSRTRPPAIALALADRLGAELIRMGSAGAKVAAVVLGEADAYVHSGGLHEWDSAAPAAVALTTGLHVSRIDGSALVYNQPDPWLPDLLVCRKDLSALLLKGLADLRS